MRSSGYVSIEEMGTSRQSPKREEYYNNSQTQPNQPQASQFSQPQPMAPVFAKGRTLIRDIDASDAVVPQSAPPPVYMPPQSFSYSSQKQNAAEPSCSDVARHIASCPLCNRVYNPDPMVYYMVIAVLVAIIAILLFRKLNI